MVLTWLDYLVIAGYLLAITAFGSWFARFQKTTRDYFLTGRSVPWWAICFTIVATETSTLSFIGVPAGAYAGNMTFLQLAIGYIVGRILVSVRLHPGLFPRRAVHVLRAAPAALRPGREEQRGDHLRCHPHARGRGAALRDGTRDFRRHPGARAMDSDSPWRRHDHLHRSRRRRRGDLDRRRADVRLRGRGADCVLRAAVTDPGRMGDCRFHGRSRRQGPGLRLQHGPDQGLHVLGGALRRHRPHTLDARDRPVPGAAPALGAQCPRRANRAGHERLHRLCAVRALPDHRRDAVTCTTSRCRCRGR